MARIRIPAAPDRRRAAHMFAVALALTVASCAAAPPSAAGARAPTSRADHTEADARFMRDMVAHHAQALLMTALVPGRTPRPDLRLLARRIEASQQEEIERMQRWLEVRGEPLADTTHAGHGAHDMPGMATPAQLARLRDATGAAFDRLFLELMIRHHEGALTMVARLFETAGAGLEPELYRFATDIDGDQRAEIARMRRVLAGS